MEESLLSSPPGGPVELCIGDCSADYRALSSQTYSFVVRTPPLTHDPSPLPPNPYRLPPNPCPLTPAPWSHWQVSLATA